LIKKISFIFLISLISQVFSIFALSYIIKKEVNNDFVEKIALLESAFSIITSVLAFGILQIATRDIVKSKDWRNIVTDTQNTRMSFALILLLIGFILYLITSNFIFLLLVISPFIAHNVNYALYAKGYSTYATIASSLRLLIPSLLLMIFGYFNFFSNTYYLIFFLISLLVSSVFSNFFLENKPTYRFKVSFYKKYLETLKIGITDLAIVFLETGILFFAAFFYEELEISNTYLVLKIYVLVKGVQRLVFQIFYNELVNSQKVVLFNKIIFIIGFFYFIISFNYNEDFLFFLFSKSNYSLIINFKILGFSLLIGSILLASIARTLVLKNDKVYIKSYTFSLVIAFICMILISYTNWKLIGISLSLLIGEIVLFLFIFINIKKDFDIKKYYIFMFFHVFLFLVFLICKLNFNLFHSIIVSIIIEFLYIIFFLFFNKKHFF
jgi:hypothetical protein